MKHNIYLTIIFTLIFQHYLLYSITQGEIPTASSSVSAGGQPTGPATAQAGGVVPTKQTTAQTGGVIPTTPATAQSGGAIPVTPTTAQAGGVVPTKQATAQTGGVIPTTPATAQSGGAVPVTPATAQTGGAISAPTTVNAIVTNDFIEALQDAHLLGKSFTDQIQSYLKAFNIITGSYKSYNIPVTLDSRNSYPVVVYDTIRGLLINKLQAISQYILTVVAKKGDYNAQVSSFLINVQVFDGYISSCEHQFTTGSAAALQEYNTPRSSILFTLFFTLLDHIVSTKTTPTQKDITTAKSYFDLADATWSSAISLPGYDTADTLKQALYQNMATLYSSYAQVQLNQITPLKTFSEYSDSNSFLTLMTDIMQKVTTARDAYAQAANLYNKLITLYPTPSLKELSTTYNTLNQLFSSGINYYNQQDYSSAAQQFKGQQVLYAILLTKANYATGFSNVSAGKTAINNYISSYGQALKTSQTQLASGTLFDSATLMPNLVNVCKEMIADYQNAIISYQQAADITTSHDMQLSLKNNIVNIQNAITVLQAINTAGTLIQQGDSTLTSAQTVSDVNAADALYSKVILLAQEADLTNTSSNSYIGIYNFLSAHWSFEQYFKRQIALRFKYKGDSILPSTYVSNPMLESFVFALYLKAYSYRSALLSAEQNDITSKLHKADLLEQANSLLATAKAQTDWTPIAGVDHYTSKADNAWQNAINTFMAAYNMFISTKTSFEGADTAYYNALLDYATAYLANVPDGFYKEAGGALIYYKAYLQNKTSEIESTISKNLSLYFANISNALQNIQDQNFDTALKGFNNAVTWRKSFDYFLIEQANAYTNQASIKPLQEEFLLVKNITNGTITCSSPFGNLVQNLGNLELDFANLCVKNGDSSYTLAQTNIQKAAGSISSSSSSYDIASAKAAQTLVSSAQKAYQQAAQLYDSIQSNLVSLVTPKISATGIVLYALSQVNTVNPQLPDTYYGNAVYGLYFLDPAFTLIPTAEIVVDEYIKSLTQKTTLTDQETQSLGDYLQGLAAQLYLYYDLNASGLSLSQYSLTYDQVAQYFKGLKNNPVDSVDNLKTVLSLTDDNAQTVHDYLVDAYTYYKKINNLVSNGIKGIKSSLLLYATPSNTLYLIERNKPTIALPTPSLQWYQTPSAFYNNAQTYFTSAGFNSMATTSNILGADLYISDAYQINKKINYLMQKETDSSLIDALCYSDEFSYLQKGKEQIASLQLVAAATLETVLGRSLSNDENQTIQVISYYYTTLLSDISSTFPGDIVGDIEKSYGKLLSLFLVGDPTQPAYQSLLRLIASEYRAAQGAYTDSKKSDQAMEELASFFERSGDLARIFALPLDTTQPVAKILHDNNFSLHSYRTAANYYYTASAVVPTADTQKLGALAIKHAKAYFDLAIENLSAYVLLRNTESNFSQLALTYSAWQSQQQAVERQIVSISQADIDLYQSLNNLVLDTLIYLMAVMGQSATAAPATAASDDIKTQVSTLLQQNNVNISELLTDDTVFSKLTWNTLEQQLSSVLNTLSTSTESSDIVLQKISALATQLYNAVTIRYNKDWEGSAASADTLSNLLDALQARETALNSVNYLD